MLVLELAILKSFLCGSISWQLKINEYHKEITDYFAHQVGVANLTAAHYVVLESLNELIKNALDADANTLFVDNSSLDKELICVFDDGAGFTSDFLGCGVTHLDYGLKLAGLSAIFSDKKGKLKLGGHGRGLAQAYEVIDQFNGCMICCNRTDGCQGAQINFSSPFIPVPALKINKLFNEARQGFCSHHCNTADPNESEATVRTILEKVSFFSGNRKKNKECCSIDCDDPALSRLG